MCHGGGAKCTFSVATDTHDGPLGASCFHSYSSKTSSHA